MLIDADGKVFVGKRLESEEGNGWQMPQGGIDAGEEPRVAAWRELEEEVGTVKGEIIGETRDWLAYDVPDALLGKVWEGRYRGQKQKWFAVRFTGSDADIRLDRHLKPEFSAYRWVEASELPGLIVDFKRPVYVRLIEEFRPLIEAVRRG